MRHTKLACCCSRVLVANSYRVQCECCICFALCKDRTYETAWSS